MQHQDDPTPQASALTDADGDPTNGRPRYISELEPDPVVIRLRTDAREAFLAGGIPADQVDA